MFVGQRFRQPPIADIRRSIQDVRGLCGRCAIRIHVVGNIDRALERDRDSRRRTHIPDETVSSDRDENEPDIHGEVCTHRTQRDLGCFTRGT